MNEKEKNDFYTAMCRCCLLAESMKTCTDCRFKVGLLERVALVEFLPIPVSMPAHIGDAGSGALQAVRLSREAVLA